MTASNESKFNMWRAIIAMAHADGVLHANEIVYLRGIFDKMRERNLIGDDKYQTLLDDIEHPQDIDDVLPLVTEPAYRSQITHFARLLAFRDGKFHPSEEDLLKKFEGIQSPVPESLKAEIRANVQKELLIHESEKDSIRPDKKTPFSALIDKLAQIGGRDLLDE